MTMAWYLYFAGLAFLAYGIEESVGTPAAFIFGGVGLIVAAGARFLAKAVEEDS